MRIVYNVVSPTEIGASEVASSCEKGDAPNALESQETQGSAPRSCICSGSCVCLRWFLFGTLVAFLVHTVDTTIWTRCDPLAPNPIDVCRMLFKSNAPWNAYSLNKSANDSRNAHPPDESANASWNAYSSNKSANASRNAHSSNTSANASWNAHSSNKSAKWSADAGIVLTEPANLTDLDSCRAPLHNLIHHPHGPYWSKQYVFPDLLKNMSPDQNFQSLLPFLEKLHRGEQIQIVVLGGSETAGIECHQQGVSTKFNNKACAWPRRLANRLRTMYPTHDASTLQLDNLAQGGTPTPSWMAGIGAAFPVHYRNSVNLVILDTLVNDCQLPSKGLGETIEQSFEKLIRSLRIIVPKAQLMVFIAGCPTGCIPLALHQLKVARYYHLPTLNWAQLAEDYGKSMPDLWRGGTHPKWVSHQLIADTMAVMLGKTWQSSCSKSAGADPFSFLPEPLAPEEVLRRYHSCLSPLRIFDARMAIRGKGLQPTIHSGWRLFEDRPGKPGWIATTPGAKIQFQLEFGSEKLIAITFLKSYESMGIAQLFLDDGGEKEVVDGLYSDKALRVSQSHTIWIQLTRGRNPGGFDGGGEGFTAKIGRQANLTVVLLDSKRKGMSKFKVLEVTSC